MSRLSGRYFSKRDLRMINSINAELIRDIVETFVALYKMCPEKTITNIYGESGESGKVYQQPIINVPCLIEHPDTTTKNEGFGPDKVKTGLQFRFQELQLKKVDFYPEIGDIIGWDDSFFTIHNVIQEQHLGGQYEKSHSFLCDAYMESFSTLNIIERAKE